MAVPYDPLVRLESSYDVTTPISISAILADAVQSTPYEGVWVPWSLASSGSVELSGSMSTVSAQLYGTNLISPLNALVVTIGGSATNGDVVSLNFNTPLGVVTATTPIVTSETVTQMAAALAAFINASTAFAALGMSASSVAGALTVTWPVRFPGNNQVAPVVQVTSSVTGGASETVAVAVGTTGSVMGAAFTTLGLSQISAQARWLKMRISTLTGGGASVTAMAQGTA